MVKCQIQQKDLITGNIHDKHQSPKTHFSKVISKDNVLPKIGQTPRSRSQGQKCWCPLKGLFTRNTLVKYQSSSIHCSNVINMGGGHKNY